MLNACRRQRLLLMLWTRVWTTCLLLARSTPLLLPPPLENKPATHPTQKDILKLAPAGTNTEAFTGFTASKVFAALKSLRPR